MKVCEVCGAEIATKDGDNRCEACDRKEAFKVGRNKARREREAVLKELGLVKVRGALGGTYWE